MNNMCVYVFPPILIPIFVFWSLVNLVYGKWRSRTKRCVMTEEIVLTEISSRRYG